MFTPRRARLMSGRELLKGAGASCCYRPEEELIDIIFTVKQPTALSRCLRSMRTLSLARVAAVAALLALGAGCAAAPRTASRAGGSAAPPSSPATTVASSQGPAAPAPGGVYDRVFSNPDLTVAG